MTTTIILSILAFLQVFAFGIGVSEEKLVSVSAVSECNSYWYALSVTIGSKTYQSVSHIYLSNSANDWKEGIQTQYGTGNYVYQFSFSSSWSLNYNVKIVFSDGSTLIKNDAITSFVEGTKFNIGSESDAGAGSLPTGSDSDSFKITANNDCSSYYYSLTVGGLDSTFGLYQVYLSNGANGWTLGQQANYNSLIWTWNFGTSWTLNYNVKIVATDGTVLIAYGIINSFQSGSIFYSEDSEYISDAIPAPEPAEEPSDDDTVSVTSVSGCNSYWYALRVTIGSETYQSVSHIYLSNSANDWKEGTRTEYGNGFYVYQFSFSSSWSLNYNVKIVFSDGSTLIKYDSITSFVEGTKFVIGSKSGASASAGATPTTGSDSFKITANNDCSSYYFSLTVGGLDSSFGLYQVYLSNGENDWTLGQQASYNSLVWTWNFGTSWSLNYNVKIVSTDGTVLVAYGIIYSFQSGSVFYSEDSKYISDAIPAPEPAAEPSDDDTVYVTPVSGCNSYWYSLRVTIGSKTYQSVSHIYLSNSANDWKEGIQREYGNGQYVYEFSFTSSWSLSYNVKIIFSNGATLIKNNVITSFVEGTTFEIGKETDASASAGATPTGSDSDTFEITANNDCSSYYYSLTVGGLDSTFGLYQVYLSNGANGWTLGQQASYNSLVWTWNFGTSWSLNYNVKIVSTDGTVLISYGIINSFESGSKFYSTEGTDVAPAPVPSDDEIDENDEVSVTALGSCSSYWYALTVTIGSKTYQSVSHIYLSNSANDWKEGSEKAYTNGQYVYQFTFGSSWSLNYNVKIIFSDGSTLIKNSAITSFVEGTTFKIRTESGSEANPVPGATDSFKITANDACSSYYYSLTVGGLDSTFGLYQVYLSNGANDWTLGQQANYNNLIWTWNFGTSWSLNYNVKIVATDGTVLISYGIINSFESGRVFYSSDNEGNTEPVPAAAPAPETVDENENENENMVELVAVGGCTVYWYGFTITIGSEYYVTVTKVYLSNDENDWKEVTQKTYSNGGTWYSITFGGSWSLPYNVKIITSSGHTIIKNGAITSHTKGTTFEIGYESGDSSSSEDNNDYGNYNYYVPTVASCGSNKYVTLTFDDGPTLENDATNEIMCELNDMGIVGTFFVSPGVDGDSDSILELKCDMIEKLVENGHSVQIGSWTHTDFNEMTYDNLKSEISKTSLFIKECGGVSPTIIRPPYGSLSLERAQYLSDLGYIIALWNCDSKDWQNINDYETISNVIKNDCLCNNDDESKNGNGAISISNGDSLNILMHENSIYKKDTLKQIVAEIQKKVNGNYKYVTANECYNDCNTIDIYGICREPSGSDVWVVNQWNL